MSGLAYDHDGMAESCMGIAVADADRNGLLDLFITKFYHESNTFYQQQSQWFFTDETHAANLHGPGL